MSIASDLARRLATEAEAVCRYYLSNGHLAGHYWLAGDVANSRGCSLYVHLAGPRAGKWTDAATGQHGDLLDLIRLVGGLAGNREALIEAQRFLGLRSCRTEPDAVRPNPELPKSSAIARARRLFASGQTLPDTLAELYLRRRGIATAARHSALRYHPSCFYRDLGNGKTMRLPALLAAVTDGAGNITGIHRTWLDPSGDGKARVETPRRALGRLLGNAVRFTTPAVGNCAVALVGEGVETVLSLAETIDGMAMASALSANHLAAFTAPPKCRRLYIVVDKDRAGLRAVDSLRRTLGARGVVPRLLLPRLGDFNDDLQRFGLEALRRHLGRQLHPDDCECLRSED